MPHTPKPRPPARQKLDEIFGRTSRADAFKRLDGTQLFFCALLIALNLAVLKTDALGRVEDMLLDYLLRRRPAAAAHPAIALIEIDAESLRAVGNWPWPWQYHAEMTEQLHAWGARAVVFDLVFDDADLPDEAERLETAFRSTPNVYLPVSLQPKSEKKIWVHSLPVVLEPGGGGKVWRHSLGRLEQYVQLGHRELEPDFDGVLRRIWPYTAWNHETYPHLALQVAYDVMEVPLPDPENPALPLDDQGRLLINWTGKWQEGFQRYSYADLVRSFQAQKQGLAPRVPSERIRGKVCLIGLTAPGLAETQVTALETGFPVLGVYANVLQNVLEGKFIRPLSFSTRALLLAGLGVLATLLFAVFRNVVSFAAGLSLSLAWSGVALVFFYQKGIWLPVFHPLLLILTLFIFSTVYDHVVSKRERSRLFDLATRDGLTGLYVIRHFREILNAVVLDAQKSGEPLSLLLIDIDNFKPINDTYGHPAGDFVLRKTAAIICSCFRAKRAVHEVDFVARYGGEEFIVMLRNALLVDAALKVAERIRKNVEDGVFEWEGKRIPVTVSAGAASLHAGESIPDLMVRRADEALYEAKRAGKNRVCVETKTPD